MDIFQFISIIILVIITEELTCYACDELSIGQYLLGIKNKFKKQPQKSLPQTIENENPKTFLQIQNGDNGWVVELRLGETMNDGTKKISKVSLESSPFNHVMWMSDSHFNFCCCGWTFDTNNKQEIKDLNTFGPLLMDYSNVKVYAFTSKKLAQVCYYDFLLKKEKQEQVIIDNCNTQIDIKSAIEKAQEYIESLKGQV